MLSKKLFLTSSVHAVASDIAKRIDDLNKNNKLAFIITPSEVEEGDMSWLENDRKALADAGFNVTDYTITNKSKSQIEQDLEKFRFIYVSGGDTLYFLKKSQETGFIDVVKDLILNKGKIYIGTSAGSIIAGPKPHDYLLNDNNLRELKNTHGFNFVNFLVLPHWGSEDFRDLYLKSRLKIAYHEDQLPLFVLTDYQYLEVIDDNIIVHDVRRRL